MSKKDIEVKMIPISEYEHWKEQGYTKVGGDAGKSCSDFFQLLNLKR